MILEPPGSKNLAIYSPYVTFPCVIERSTPVFQMKEAQLTKSVEAEVPSALVDMPYRDPTTLTKSCAIDGD